MKQRERWRLESEQLMYERHLEAVAESGILRDPNWGLPPKDEAIAGLVWAGLFLMQRRLG